jgi:hypothetical protein
MNEWHRSGGEFFGTRQALRLLASSPDYDDLRFVVVALRVDEKRRSGEISNLRPALRHQFRIPVDGLVRTLLTVLCSGRSPQSPPVAIVSTACAASMWSGWASLTGARCVHFKDRIPVFPVAKIFSESVSQFVFGFHFT